MSESARRYRDTLRRIPDIIVGIVMYYVDPGLPIKVYRISGPFRLWKWVWTQRQSNRTEIAGIVAVTRVERRQADALLGLICARTHDLFR